MKIENLELFKSTAAEGPVGEEHRRAFAASLVLPIGNAVAAEATIRQIFWVDNIEPGQAANYPRDINEINAWEMPGRGAVPRNVIGGDELFVHTFIISSSADWSIQFARDGRYNVAERELARMKDTIIREENAHGWAVINAAVTKGNTVTNAGDTSLTKTLLNKSIKELDKKEGYKADLIVMHPGDVADFREWASGQIDNDTLKQIHTRNSLGSIWGVDIMRDYNVAPGTFYVFDTTKLGVMPVRQNVQIMEDISAIRNLSISYIGWEEVGFSVTDANAVVKGTFSTI